MQYYRRRFRRFHDRERCQVSEVEPDAAGWCTPGMGVPGNPVRAKGVCQTRVVIMLALRRLRQQAEASRLCQPGEPQGQEDLAEQCRNPDPGCNAAPDARVHRRLARPVVAMHAEHLRRYFNTPAAQPLPTV